MRASSEFDKGLLIKGMIRSDGDPSLSKDPCDLPPSEYLRCVAKMLKYLSHYSNGAPNIATMTPRERQEYVLGYGLPFARAAVPQEIFWVLGPDGKDGAPGEALIRWTERIGRRDGHFFPKRPAELVEICLVVMRDSAPGWKPCPALEGPPISREDRVKISNRIREKMGIELLQENHDD